MEEWKDVVGYEGYYQVSNMGRVKSLKRVTNNQFCKQDYFLKQTKTNAGYLKVILIRNSKRTNKNIHRLVAETFIDNSNKLPCVNHKNGNKQDNRVENLEWVNFKQNIEHAIRNELKKSRGIKMYNPSTKETVSFIIRKDINKYLNRKVSQDLITRCCNKKRKTAYGMIWEYIQEKSKYNNKARHKFSPLIYERRKRSYTK